MILETENSKGISVESIETELRSIIKKRGGFVKETETENKYYLW